MMHNMRLVCKVLGQELPGRQDIFFFVLFGTFEIPSFSIFIYLLSMNHAVTAVLACRSEAQPSS